MSFGSPVGKPITSAAITRIMAPLILLAGCTALISCGSSADGQSGTATTASGALETSPISLSTALADTASGLSTDQTCPFLTTATAIDTVKTTQKLILREASNTQCIWNYNIGFEIRVTIEPAADAMPIEKRLYNLDNPPLVKPQSGPGAGAAIAYDTTWKERPPRPYAFGFALGSDYIFIRTTGVATSEEKLRRAADEIARMLPEAPTIASSGNPASSPAAFQVCGIWSKEALKGIFGVEEGGSVSSHPSNSKTCIASIFPSRSAGNKISLDFIFSEPTKDEYEFRKSNGWIPVEIAAKRALLLEKEDQFGFVTQYIAPMENGSFGLTVISKDPAMAAKARLLFENALSRISD